MHATKLFGGLVSLGLISVSSAKRDRVSSLSWVLCCVLALFHTSYRYLRFGRVASRGRTAEVLALAVPSAPSLSKEVESPWESADHLRE